MTLFLRVCFSARTNYILWCLLAWSSLLPAQRNPVYSFRSTAPSVQDNQLELIDFDTFDIEDMYDCAASFMEQRHYINLDSVRHYAFKAIAMSQKIGYKHGEMYTYQTLGWTYLYKNVVDSSKFYFRKALAVDEMECDTAKMIWHYVCHGWAYFDNFEYDSASIVFTKSMDLAITKRDTANILQAVSQLARSYRFDGNFLESARYSLEHLRLAKLQRDTSELIFAYKILSNLYSYTGVHEKEVELTKNILDLAATMVDSNSQRWFNALAADHYLTAGQYDSALHYTRLNLPKTNNFRSVPTIWLTMGNIFFKTDQIDSACYYYQAFHQAALRTNMQIDPDTYLGLGRCQFTRGNKKGALEYYKEAENSIKEKNLFAELRTMSALYEYYDSTGNTLLSLTYLKKFKTIEDSIQKQRDAFNDGIVDLLTASQKLEAEVQLLTENNMLQKKLNINQIQQRNTLFGGAGFIMFISGLGFYRYRKSKTLKSKQALMNERLRISRDLHDEVGATLSGIALYSHVAKEQMKNADSTEAEHSLDIMQKSAGEMVTKLSDIVWLINPDQDTIHQLFDRLEDYAQQMAAVKNMMIKMNVDATISDAHLPLEDRRNIYLFCKEAINNAVKYSEAQLLEIKAEKTGNIIRFSINDNGKGFDEMFVQRGNGLNNMKSRAEEIGSTVKINSIVSKGTKVEMHYSIESV